jgi:hypothetical protein
MEKIYNAYEKKIDGITFYFVKEYQAFPEYKNVSPILRNYGMHSDFKKACKIAMVTDPAVQQKLSEQAGVINTGTNRKAEIYSFKFPEIKFPLLLKLFWR